MKRETLKMVVRTEMGGGRTNLTLFFVYFKKSLSSQLSVNLISCNLFPERLLARKLENPTDLSPSAIKTTTKQRSANMEVLDTAGRRIAYDGIIWASFHWYYKRSPFIRN